MRLTPMSPPCNRYPYSGRDGRLSPQQQTNQMRPTPRTTAAGGAWAPYLPKPTAKRAAQQLRQEERHGDRVQGIAEARRLWTRLDDWATPGPADPEEGFMDEVLEYAPFGRGYIKKAMGGTTTRAWKRWRSIRRAHIRSVGGKAICMESTK